mmetsp:Transcript_54810/g.91342  ORF Transcript_54810/g.91342 Transcript_54810/m.91342 type:complete len:230 (-) Transcript_54810:988-1677(-)
MSSFGRFLLTKSLKRTRIASMSSFSFALSSSVVSLNGVRVLLNSPAVVVLNTTPSRFRRSNTLGCSLITPMDPRTAKGEATSRSAVHAIMYPPLAATSSTQMVSFSPRALSRISWEADRPYPVTVPPPLLRMRTTSSPRSALAEVKMAVTSCRSCLTCAAWTFPKNLSTNTFLAVAVSFSCGGSAKMSSPDCHPCGESLSSFCRATLCSGFRTLLTASMYCSSPSIIVA